MSFKKLVISSVALLALASAAHAQAPAPAAAPATPAAAGAPVTRDQLPALVREVLLNDPQILTDAIQKMRDKQLADQQQKAKEAVLANKNELFNDPSTPSIGDPKVTDINIVQFFDYHCGYCKRFLGDITKLVAEDKKVRVIFKEYPILSEDSVTASRAALAVNRIAKDKYFPFHTALMAHKGKFDEKAIMDIAQKLGIDGAKLKTEMQSADVSAALEKDRKLGEALGVTGTPSVIVGEEMQEGAVPLEELKKIIAAQRAKAAGAPAPAKN